MKNLRIGVRLGLAFAVMVLLVAIVAIVGITRLAEQNAMTLRITDNLYVKASTASRIAFLATDMGRNARSLVLRTNADEIAQRKAIYDSERDEIDEKVKVLDRLVDTERGKQLLGKLKLAGADFFPFLNDVVALGVQNKNAEATEVLFGNRNVTQATYIAALQDMVKFQEDRMDDGAADAGRIYAQAKLIMIVVLILAIVFAAVLGWMVTRSVTLPIAMAVTAVDVHAELTHWGCGQNLGLPGGSPCFHTKTAFGRSSCI